jgi:hypothetical protein
MQIFATSEKVKPDTEYLRGFSFSAFKRTSVQVTRQSLQQELRDLGHDLLYQI